MGVDIHDAAKRGELNPIGLPMKSSRPRQHDTRSERYETNSLTFRTSCRRSEGQLTFCELSPFRTKPTLFDAGISFDCVWHNGKNGGNRLVCERTSVMLLYNDGINQTNRDYLVTRHAEMSVIAIQFYGLFLFPGRNARSNSDCGNHVHNPSHAHRLTGWAGQATAH